MDGLMVMDGTIGLSICEPIGKSIGSPGGAGEVLGTAGDLLIGCPIGCPIG